MRQILISLSFVVFVILLVAKGTSSYFSNYETLDDNFGIAGQINLLVGNVAYKNGQIIPEMTWDLQDEISQSILAFDNLLINDSGSNIVSIQISDNPAWLCSQINSNIPSVANQILDFYLWADDGDGVLETNEPEINHAKLSQFSSNTLTLATSAENYFHPNLATPLVPDETYFLGIAWCVGDLYMTGLTPDLVNDQRSPTTETFFECDSNTTTNDSFSTNISLSFYTVQARNNYSFSCEAW